MKFESPNKIKKKKSNFDFRNSELTGKKAEEKLESVGITANKNMVPYDEESPFVTSGLRLGTPAMTTRGFGRTEFRAVGNLIADVFEGKAVEPKQKVAELCASHPMP